MNREVHVRICEGRGVRFPPATRRLVSATRRTTEHRAHHDRDCRPATMGARRQASDGRRATAGPRRSAHDALSGGSQSPPTDFRWQPLGLAADDGPVSRLLQAVATFDRSHPTGAGTPTGRPPAPRAAAATRAAVSLAHPVVVASPSSSTTAPQPAVIHQPGWLAVAKLVRSSPWMPAVATAPTTATPRDWPTCRLVEAMAAATPACARGMPETAVLVIGAFTRPNPAPKTT